jgi:hypothetical protein
MSSTNCLGGEYSSGVVHLDIKKIIYTDALYLEFTGWEQTNQNQKQEKNRKRGRNQIIKNK